MEKSLKNGNRTIVGFAALGFAQHVSSQAYSFWHLKSKRRPKISVPTIYIAIHTPKIKSIKKKACKSIMKLFRLRASINARYISKWSIASRILKQLTNMFEKFGLRGHHGKMTTAQLWEIELSTNRFCSACVYSRMQFSAFQVQNTV